MSFNDNLSMLSTTQSCSPFGSPKGRSRSHHGDPSDVFHVACCGVREFIWCFVQPPHPFCGRVMSTIQFGALKALADVSTVFQSARLAGEKIFIPLGQLFFCDVFRTSAKIEQSMRGRGAHFNSHLPKYAKQSTAERTPAACPFGTIYFTAPKLSGPPKQHTSDFGLLCTP